MDWVLYFGVPVCALILYFLYQAYKNKQNNLRKLRSAFGKKADKKYIYEEFENISHGFFLQNDDDGNVIDDITWNDLNMDAVYKQMDCTASSLGQEALYSMLRTPIVEDEELGRRKKLIDYFTEHENERTKLSPETRHLVMTINMYGSDPDYPAERVISLTERLLTQYAGASHITARLIKANE